MFLLDGSAVYKQICMANDYHSDCSFKGELRHLLVDYIFFYAMSGYISTFKYTVYSALFLGEIVSNIRRKQTCQTWISEADNTANFNIFIRI